MIIGFDFDDVLVDTNTALQQFHNRRYGTSLTRADVITYSLDFLWGCSHKEMTRRIDEFFDSPEHEMILPVRGALEAVRELQSKSTIVVITSRALSKAPRTRACVMRHFPSLADSMHFARSDAHREGEKTKGQLCRELGVQVFVDDATHLAEGVAPFVNKSLLFDAPWNRRAVLCRPNMRRVHSWNEILLEVATSI